MPETSSLLGQHFAYAHGRMGVLQQLLVQQSDVDRLLGASDMRDFDKMLTELKFTSIIDQSLSETESILAACAAWIRNEVEQMSPLTKRPAFQIIWLSEDTPLLSYLLKKKAGLTSAISEEPAVSMTAYNPGKLRSLVEENDPSDVPSHLVAFVQSINAKSDLTPQKIDTAVAEFVASLQHKLARASGSVLLGDYVRHSIDIRNIATALRLQSLEKEERKDYLIEGGTIAPTKLTGDMNEITTTIDRSPIAFNLSDVTQLSDDPVALERALAQVLAHDITRMWNVPLSIEPLFAFAAIGVAQLRVLRTIAIGKRNELGAQEVKQLLPPFLSASHYLT